jgi:LmbE family N-acetylglucosaminyl deacetylase
MKKYSLLLVAHPDDETIFFSGLLQVYRRRPWKVVCVTDGNGDGLASQRGEEFKRACALFKVKSYETWNFPDRYNERLNIADLIKHMQQEKPVEVFTHNILGEYGHPHHQDVSLAAHRAFNGQVPVWSSAYNCQAKKVFKLTSKAYQLKCKALAEIYFGETHRFARWLPAYNTEGVTQVTLSEVEALYAFLSGEGPAPDMKKLSAFAWFRPYLEEFRRQIHTRPF